MRCRTDEDTTVRSRSWLPGILGGGGAKQTKKTEQKLQEIGFGPVTHRLEHEANTKSIQPSTWDSIAAGVQRFMRKIPVAAAGVALGAMLLTGCATSRMNTHVTGLPIHHASIVTLAPGADTVQRTSLEIDSRVVKQRIAAMEKTIMEGATPAMAMISDHANIVQTVYGNYKKNIIPEFVVQNPTGKDLRVELIFLLPVSGHVGNTLQEQQENARHYAEIDRHKVWIEYADGTKQTLVENIDPKGKLVVPVKLEVTLKPGENQIVFSPLPNGRPELRCHDHSFPVDPSGFDVGRREIYKVIQ